MSLIKCKKCGEMFSDSYKTCPFCEEDDAYYGGRATKRRRRAEPPRRKAPSILGPVVVLVLILLVLLVVWLLFGDQIKTAIGGQKPPVEDVIPEPTPTPDPDPVDPGDGEFWRKVTSGSGHAHVSRIFLSKNVSRSVWRLSSSVFCRTSYVKSLRSDLILIPIPIPICLLRPVSVVQERTVGVFPVCRDVSVPAAGRLAGGQPFAHELSETTTRTARSITSRTRKVSSRALRRPPLWRFRVTIRCVSYAPG